MLLTPGMATTAIAAEGGYGRSAPVAVDKSSRFTPWTPPWNLTGQPAVTLPAGFGADGLPLSVQMVGRPGPRTCCTRWPARSRPPGPGRSHRPSL